MEKLYAEYLDFLDSLSQTLARLTDIAKEKAAAVKRDDLLALDDCIQREQAMSLSLRNLEQKRAAMLDRLGLSGVPLSGLVEHCPASLQPRAKTVTEGLRNQYSIYTSAADVARTTLECNLHQMEKLMTEEAQALEQAGIPPRSITDIRA